MEGNQEIFDKIMVNTEFRNDVKSWLTKKIYQRFNDNRNNPQKKHTILADIKLYYCVDNQLNMIYNLPQKGS